MAKEKWRVDLKVMIKKPLFYLWFCSDFEADFISILNCWQYLAFGLAYFLHLGIYSYCLSDANGYFRKWSDKWIPFFVNLEHVLNLDTKTTLHKELKSKDYELSSIFRIVYLLVPFGDRRRYNMWMFMHAFETFWNDRSISIKLCF